MERETRPDGTVIETPREARGTWTISPRSLEIDVAQTTHALRRAIYEVPAQASTLTLRARFEGADVPTPEADVKILWDEATWGLGVSDLRGLGVVRLAAGGRALAVAGHPQAGILNVRAPMEAELSGTVTLEGTIEVKGVSSLRFTPAGLETQVKLRSDWGHPSFDGSHLPAEREVTAEGFTARWSVSSFARDLPAVAENAMPLQGRAFGVTLVDPTDGYAQVGRSLKYGLLFVLLTLCGFLVLELASGVRVHPAQYGLLGLAQVSFYLLLLALSEHLSIGAAYLAAGLATTLLTGAYALWTFGQARFAAVVLAGTGVSYAFQYTLVRLEDHALLLGALLLFSALALVMRATRRVRWY